MDADAPLPTDVPTLHGMVRGLRGRVAELDAAVRADAPAGVALAGDLDRRHAGRYAVPGRDTMPHGHFWVAVGDAAAPFTVFDFTTGYSADEGPVRFFDGFRGYLQADV